MRTHIGSIVISVKFTTLGHQAPRLSVSTLKFEQVIFFTVQLLTTYRLVELQGEKPGSLLRFVRIDLDSDGPAKAVEAK